MLERSTIETPQATLDAYYEDLKQQNLAPLWTQPGGADEPHSRFVPFRWRWQDVRPQAMRALELVGTQEAERRVICCVNPAAGRGATPTLVANVQVVGPGEIARAHRHTAAALRMIIESTGGYTVVNGEAIPMLPGDLVLTPNWTWHDHANDSQTPMIWLDGLDAPLVGMLEAQFREQYPDEVQTPREDMDVSHVKWGSGSLRPAWDVAQEDHSPLWHYPWTQTKAALDRLASIESRQPARRRHPRVHQPTRRWPRHADDRLLRPGAQARPAHRSRTATRPAPSTTSSRARARRLSMANASHGTPGTFSRCQTGPATSMSMNRPRNPPTFSASRTSPYIAPSTCGGRTRDVGLKTERAVISIPVRPEALEGRVAMALPRPY